MPDDVDVGVPDDVGMPDDADVEFAVGDVGVGDVGVSDVGSVSLDPPSPATAVFEPVLPTLVPVVVTVASWVFEFAGAPGSSGPPAPAGVVGVGSLCGTAGGGCDSIVVGGVAGASLDVPVASAVGGSPVSACARPARSSSPHNTKAQTKSARASILDAVPSINAPRSLGRSPIGPSPCADSTISG
ncbi:MAG TPA: hypothetical protein VL119_07660 [Acidimicrobiia bacterium]|nr:hypothetical protein [Acidimicrobiia bacterium]